MCGQWWGLFRKSRMEIFAVCNLSSKSLSRSLQRLVCRSTSFGINELKHEQIKISCCGGPGRAILLPIFVVSNFLLQPTIDTRIQENNLEFSSPSSNQLGFYPRLLTIAHSWKREKKKSLSSTIVCIQYIVYMPF